MPRRKKLPLRPSTTPARVYRATADIPTIKARAGEYVLDPGTGTLCVFHGERANALTPEDGFKLEPVQVGAR